MKSLFETLAHVPVGLSAIFYSFFPIFNLPIHFTILLFFSSFYFLQSPLLLCVVNTQSTEPECSHLSVILRALPSAFFETPPQKQLLIHVRRFSSSARLAQGSVPVARGVFKDGGIRLLEQLQQNWHQLCV